jgi:hypothetical protein
VAGGFEGCRDELRYLQAMSFFGMESIVEVILIIVRCRVGRGGVNMDVPEGDKARRCNGWKAKFA